MADFDPYAADNASQEDMIIAPLGVASDETLSNEEKLDRLVAMKQEVGRRGADGTLDPGLVTRQMQEIDNAMAKVQSASDPADTRGGARQREA